MGLSEPISRAWDLVGCSELKRSLWAGRNSTGEKVNEVLTPRAKNTKIVLRKLRDLMPWGKKKHGTFEDDE